jgi:K+-sensing histidine kinase KdpD
MPQDPAPRSLDERTLLAVLSDAPDGVVIVDQAGVVLYANAQAEALFGYAAAELVGRRVELLAPDRRGGYLATHKDGRTFPVEAVLSALDTADGQLVTAFVRDAGEWQRRHQQAAATGEISNALLEGRPIEEVLTLVAQHAGAVVGGDEAWIVTPDEADPETLVVRAAVGSDATTLLGMTVPRGRSMSGQVMEGGAPALVESATLDPRVAAAVRALGYGPAMYIPLISADRQFGALIVARLEGAPLFSDADVASASLFAGSAAIALAFGESRAALEEGRLAAEQERIARELLSRVVHDLYAVGLSLQTTAGIVGRDQSVRPRLDESVAKLDEVIHTIRRVVFGMVEGGDGAEAGAGERPG